MALGSTQPLTEMSTRLVGLTTLPPSISRLSNVGVLTSRNPMGLHGLYYYYYLVCEAIGTAATLGLLCQARVIMKMIVEKQMECRLAGETEVLLGETLPQRHFCSSHMTRPVFEPGPPRWEAGD
jgi:hypothetical protein